jgi:hypothetical protein
VENRLEGEVPPVLLDSFEVGEPIPEYLVDPPVEVYSEPVIVFPTFDNPELPFVKPVSVFEESEPFIVVPPPVF